MISEESVKLVSKALINLKMYKGTDAVIVARHLIKCRLVNGFIELLWCLAIFIFAMFVLRAALKTEDHEKRVCGYVLVGGLIVLALVIFTVFSFKDLVQPQEQIISTLIESVTK